MSYLFIVLNLMLVYAVLATSLNLIQGYGGLFSVAHAAFFGVGAYTFAVLRLSLDLNFIVALIAAFVIAGTSSLIISIPSLRVSGEYLLLATFAVQILASSLFLELDVTGGPAGLRNIPEPSLFGVVYTAGGAMFLVTLLVAAVCWYIMFEIARSPFGRVLKAVREDEVAIISLGKNVLWLKIAVFFIGCGFAGLAGGLYASIISFINPDSFLIYTSFTIIIMVLLGGLTNPLGGVVGAFVLVVIEEVLRLLLPSSIGSTVSQVLFGLILLAVILTRPQGLLPEHREFEITQESRRSKLTPPSRVEQPANTLPAAYKPKDSAPALRLEEVAKAYGGVQAVRSVTFDVNPREILGIIGPNGAGKTTVFDLITGGVRPDLGHIYFGNRRIDGQPSYRIAQMGVGRLFQDARPFNNMTVLDGVLVSFQGAIRENPVVSWLPIDRAGERQRTQQAYALLEIVGLEAHARERAGSLSFGQQKLLAFARLLAQGAKVWLLDEPAAGIDPAMREHVREVIRQVRTDFGVTILLVEHNMEFLDGLVDRVIFMAEGRVLQHGTVQAIAQDPDLNRLYLGGLST